LKLTNVFDPITERLVGLDNDLPGPAEVVEVVDVVRAQVDLQRVEDVADRDSQGHALGPVDVEVQPGRAGAGAAEQASQTRSPVAPVDNLIRHPLQLTQSKTAPVLDDELEAAGRSQSLDRRSPKCRHHPA